MQTPSLSGKTGFWGLCFVTGALSILSMSPWFIWPILFFTLPVFIHVLDKNYIQLTNTHNTRYVNLPVKTRFMKGFTLGWFFGFGYFLAGFYWIYHAFLVERALFGWLIPFVVPLLPAFLAVFYAVAVGVAFVFWRTGWYRLLLLAVCFALTEWGRGIIFTGFPWHLMGYSLTASDLLAQNAALIGINGLTFLVILFFSLPFALWQYFIRPKNQNGLSTGTGNSTVYYLAGVSLLVLCMGIYGGWRLSGKVERHPSGMQLALVQPNILQKDKWDKSKVSLILTTYLELTRKAASGIRKSRKQQDAANNPPALIIWPESALPFLLRQEKQLLRELGQILPDNTLLVTGNIRFDDIQQRQGEPRAYNSILVINGAGKVTSIFDKKHLVMFGEYTPMRSFFEMLGLRRLVQVRGAFKAGDSPRYMQLHNIPPMGPLICFEAMFPTEVIDKPYRPHWFLNLTNDGWYGLSDGPYQHFHQSRIRALEQGLPMVRVANTGISAVIDPYGKIENYLHLGKRGVLIQSLPAKNPPTLYARYGEFIFYFMIMFSIIILYLNRKN